MQPRDERVLEHILDYCEDIANDLSAIESSRDAFMTNAAIQRSIAFCILQIGELVGKLSEALRVLSGGSRAPAAEHLSPAG